MRRAAAVAIVAVMALTGCVRVTTETTFHADETVTQHAILAADPAALDTLEQQLGSLPEGMLPDAAGTDGMVPGLAALLDPDTLREQLAPLEESMPGSVTITDYADDEGREGVEITATDVPLERIEEAGALAAGLGGAPTVEVEEGTYTVTLATGAASALAESGADTRALGLAEAAIDFSVAFTFPGLVREASAGEITGNTVTLGLRDLLGSDQVRIVAGAEPERDWGPLLRWGLVGLAAAALVGGATALVLQDRRRRASSSLPEPREPGTGPGTLTDRDGGTPGG